MIKKIVIKGAKEHNLKNVSVEIPKDQFVVITGLSGSGKSSLAFDTIYSEAQRRYIETFSVYARQFIGDLKRPDVEKIDGLSPVVAIEQKTTSKNPRSTVGTTTEIYDFLRLLFARASDAYSYSTNKKMITYSHDEIFDLVKKKFLGKKISIFSPVVKSRKGEFESLFKDLQAQGFSRVLVDGELVRLEDTQRLDRYFNHDISVLKQIATKAKSLGAERFVLDDGWFGKRDNDTTSLGDWQIDVRKYPTGLGPIVDHVKALNMQFGLWIEPEMVSPDSELYNTHPDWVLGPKDQLLGRQQMALNLSLQEVSDYLFMCIAALLNDYDITYIKWDHNRVLPISDVSQTRKVYELLARVRTKFPHVEIETCASGGGRIDFGILNYTQRVWLSDSNDAVERSKIQHNAALFLPSAVTGSHVGPRQCHTTGRIFDMKYRAWIAAQRHMGFEMDPREITDLDAQILLDVTQWYKDNRNWLMKADILRLDSSDPSVIAEMQLAQDGSRFVIFKNQIETSAQINPRPLRLAQLDPEASYLIRLINRDQIHNLSRGNPVLKNQKL